MTASHEVHQVVRQVGADLISGVFALDGMIRSGRVRGITPTLAVERRDRVLTVVTPDELWTAQRAIWRMIRRLWMAKKPLSPRMVRVRVDDRHELDWCLEHGTGIGLDIERQARLLLGIQEEQARLQRAQAEAAEALERTRETAWSAR